MARNDGDPPIRMSQKVVAAAHPDYSESASPETRDHLAAPQTP